MRGLKGSVTRMAEIAPPPEPTFLSDQTMAEPSVRADQSNSALPAAPSAIVPSADWVPTTNAPPSAHVRFVAT